MAGKFRLSSVYGEMGRASGGREAPGRNKYFLVYRKLLLVTMCCGVGIV